MRNFSQVFIARPRSKRMHLHSSSLVPEFCPSVCQLHVDSLSQFCIFSKRTKHIEFLPFHFLVDRTNGRAYAIHCCVRLSAVCDVMYCG